VGWGTVRRDEIGAAKKVEGRVEVGEKRGAAARAAGKWAAGGRRAGFLAGMAFLGLAGATWAVLAGGMVGCGQRARVPARPLVIGLQTDPIGLDPHRHNDFHTFAVLSNVYEGLTAFDGQLRVGPGLAAGWENPNDTTWIFQLRPGARFHDGRPVAAEDVVFSLERARRLPGTDVASYLLAVKGVRAVDPHTVEITTERPAATLLEKLAFVAVLPRGSPPDIRQPVGTGPYRLAGWTPGRRLELTAFERHWRGAPAEKVVWLLPITDHAERMRRLAAGELDLAAGLAPEGATSLPARGGCRVAVQESLLVWHLEMRVDRPPFADRRVRQAVDLAVDRPALVERLLLGQGRPLGQMVTPNDVGFAPDLAPTRRDLPRARALLAAAGYPRGFEVDLDYREGSRGAELVARQLAEAGIRARPVKRRWGELYPSMLAGQLTFHLGAVLAESGDASDVLDAMAHSRGTRSAYGEANASGYSDAGLDELIERSAVVLDPLKRREILQRCMRVLARDLPHVPLFAPFDLYGLREGVEWRPRLDATVLASEVRRRR
jgi:peptide/nickel transport system substrate-binding protein